MSIILDGKVLKSNNEENIVELAKSNGISITSPCYHNKRKFGGCKGCIVEINGKKHYSCVTKPQNDMDIIYNRDDLQETRKQNIQEYTTKIKNGTFTPCNKKCESGEISNYD